MNQGAFADCIFDLYGTLIDIHTDEDNPALWQSLSREYHSYGITSDPLLLKQQYQQLVEEEVQRMRRARNEQRHPYECQFEPEIDLTRVFAQLFTSGDAISPSSPLVWGFGRRFRELSMIHISLYEGAREMLLALRENGRRVWLLSNAQRVFTALELEKLGLTDCFDGIYLSSDYGCKKPDPLFFQTLLKERGIVPSHAIMVGNDGTCDIGGARMAGLHTLYLKSATSPQGDNPEADYKLQELDMKRVQEILLN